MLGRNRDRVVKHRRNSPSHRWRSQHGTKIIHRTILTAWWHAWRLNRVRTNRYYAYPCRWDQWYHNGETAKRHWHVGHNRTE